MNRAALSRLLPITVFLSSILSQACSTTRADDDGMSRAEFGVSTSRSQVSADSFVSFGSMRDYGVVGMTMNSVDDTATIETSAGAVIVRAAGTSNAPVLTAAFGTQTASVYFVDGWPVIATKLTPQEAWTMRYLLAPGARPAVVWSSMADNVAAKALAALFYSTAMAATGADSLVTIPDTTAPAQSVPAESAAERSARTLRLTKAVVAGQDGTDVSIMPGLPSPEELGISPIPTEEQIQTGYGIGACIGALGSCLVNVAAIISGYWACAVCIQAIAVTTGALATGPGAAAPGLFAAGACAACAVWLPEEAGRDLTTALNTCTDAFRQCSALAR